MYLRLNNCVSLFSVVLFFFCTTIYGQNSAKGYAKIIVEKLASDEFSGRGYVNNGLEKSAKLIEEQFIKNGIKPVHGSYRQEFEYPINIIKSSEVKLNSKVLTFGRDYLLSANSPSLKGTFEPEEFNINTIDSAFVYGENFLIGNELNRIEKISNTILFPPKKFPENYTDETTSAQELYEQLPFGIINNTISNKFKVCIDYKNKLTHNLAPYQSEKVGITLLNDNSIKRIKNLELDIKTEFNPNFKTSNIIGKLDGSIEKDSIVIISAHYDHLGKVNNSVFSGANDNASGIALLLSLAKYFSTKKTNKYTLVFCAFSGEEVGLKGSQHFVNNPPVDLEKITMVLNFDIVGTGDEGIQVVNGRKHLDKFNALVDVNVKHNLVKQIKIRGEACNSDHCPFDKKGIPAFFTYTLGGAPYYHDLDDKSKALSLSKFDEVFMLFSKYIENL
ncbi:MAG: M28 family peptidase [Flavobacteriales bacterium]|nr:M28 family peptidase [Flavobacteriales bacterium]